MRKGLKVTHKKVHIPEEGEEERIRKTESKKAMIRAEFEKHKKEVLINVSGASKINEIRLKNQLEELLTANTKKKNELQRLENSEQTLERQNLEDTQFYNTIHRFDTTKVSGNPYLSVGFHPNRTTSTIFSMRESNMAEVLSDKTASLAETLANIELLIEQEDEMGATVNDRFSELKKNQILINKKVNELKRMNDHAEKRFSDLKRIEFLARNKHAATASDLKETKDSLKELRNQEYEYKKQKEEDKRKEVEYLNNKQTEMSNVLIEIDRKRIDLQHSQEELKRLELLHEEMRDKRKNTRIVTKYIETFDALEGKKNNVSAAQQALREFADRSNTPSDASPNRGASPNHTHGKRSSSSTFKDSLNKRLSNLAEDNKSSFVKRDSVLERNYYIEKIQTFYEKHPEGPQEFVDNLIEQYQDHCYREKSQKVNYEELQNQKRTQEHHLQTLEEAIQELKGKNHYITLGRTGSKILERNEQEAIDSGMVVINSSPTTLNQAKFEFENKKDTDNDAILFTNTEAFVLRCYLYSVEMMTRISKMLYSMSNQSGGYLPEELREISKNIHTQLATIKKVKKNKPELSASQTLSEPLPELHRTHTENTSSSEKERDQDQIATLDLQEVYDTFLSLFEGRTSTAADFVSNIKNDVMITSFLTIDDIRTYLLSHQNNVIMDGQVEKVLRGIEDLRKVAIDNMLLKFNTLYKTYADFMALAQQNIDEATEYLKERGINVQVDDISNRNAEQTGFVKKAMEKKWQTLQERYDYDPARDYRRTGREVDIPVASLEAHPKANAEDDDDMDQDRLEREDLRVRLNEIATAELRKIKGELSMGSSNVQFKSRAEEEKRKAVQAKKDKERQKQAVENMTDEDFLDYQRKQLKDTKKDSVVDANEGQLLWKVQADQAQRLSQTVPLDELKKMIENSKFLAKIQILEKQKCITDGKRNFKQNTVENYIPHEPLKVPRSSTMISNPDWKIRITRNAFTPSSRATQNRLFPSSSDRLTESEAGDSPKDLSFKINNTIQASKFKPRFTPTDFTTEPTFDNEKPWTQGSKRLSTFESFKKKPSKDEEEERGLRSEGKKMSSFFETRTNQDENDEPKKKNNRIIIDTKRKRQKTAVDPQSTKSKSGGFDLPKLEKPAKKKKDGGKKKQKNAKKVVDQDNLNLLLNLQTDPMLKMVYSPSFFATTFPSVAMPEELNYQFDSFKYKAPSLLISEKL